MTEPRKTYDEWEVQGYLEHNRGFEVVRISDDREDAIRIKRAFSTQEPTRYFRVIRKRRPVPR